MCIRDRYSYLALVIGIGFIAWGWAQAPPPFRRQRLTILLATLIPCAANVVYLARGFGDLVDPTPFGFAVAGIVIFYAIFRQNLFTFSPCLLYTSDAADDLTRVDLGGRR